MNSYVLKSAFAATLFLALVGTSGNSRAGTIGVSVHQDFTSGSNPPDDWYDTTPAFVTVDFHFNLPAGFSNAVLNTTLFDAADRAVLQLNGATVSSTGINNDPDTNPAPALGGFSFDGLTSNPFIFAYNSYDLSTVFVAITGPFVVGDNLLRFFVNNTFNGILDADTDSGLIVGGGPMTLDFEGTVTFDAAATPLPAALPLFASGLGALGFLGWRRKRKA